MQKRTYLTLVLSLLMCFVCLLLPAGHAENLEEESADLSAYVLQTGGFPPVPSVSNRKTRGDSNAAVKQVIYTGLSNWQDSINISKYSLSDDACKNIYYEVLNEHPELFYVNSSIRWSSSAGVVISVTPSYDSSYTQADISAYQSAVQRILGMMDSGWNDVEKALFLHDYLVTHCEYDLTYSRHNAHDALVVGSAVCQGYALAYHDLLSKSGINSLVVSSKTLNHAWNLVTVDGSNYHVDCTWDDPSNNWYEGYCKHSHFLQSASALSKDHQSTDWVSGTVDVTAIETSSRYDNAWWQDVITAVPLIGHIGVYTRKSDTNNLYMRNLYDGSVSELSLPGSARWSVWNSNASWQGNFSSCAASGAFFYLTLPSQVWMIDLNGNMILSYQLTDEEATQGYLYGIVKDGDSLYYNIGTQPSGVSFIRSSLNNGPIIGESDGFTFKLLEDGTISITECTLRGHVTIPSELNGFTVSNLGSRLFYGVSGITSVSIPATVTSFGDDPSDNDWDYVFSYCYDLTSIDVAANNPTFCSVEGVLFSKDQSALIHYPCNRADAVYHANADYFCCTAFAACRNLSFLFIDDPDTTWYTYTFYADRALTVFYLPGGQTEQKVIQVKNNGQVQDGTDNNSWCSLVSTNEIHTLPEQLQVIEENAFEGTSILYLILPDNCILIHRNAFANSALRYIRVGASTVLQDGAIPDDCIAEIHQVLQ